MKLLAALQTWQYIAIAAVVAVALIIIICIIVWACKKAKKGAKTESVKTESVKTEPAQSVGQSSVASPEKPVRPAEEKAERDTGKVYHISKRKEDGKWQIKAEGGARAIKLFATQAEALEYGKQLAINQDARIMLHKLDGSFRKLTY
ncbi:MAG: DUF2188 domain-containing protein [Clostridia bacterium]|nr:DUF2188 domain-containing protein [Clostridia bacterium]